MFVSCVPASERGETVWASEREVLINAGLQNGEMCSGCGCVHGVFIAMCIGFLFLFIHIVGGFRVDFLGVRCYVHCFLICSTDRPSVVAICVCV